MDEKSLRYDCLPEAIPYILEDDWGFICKDKERDLVVNAFVWRYGSHKKDEPLAQWFVTEGSPAQWGSSSGRVSFVLSKKDLTIMKVFVALAAFLFSDEFLGRALSIAEIYNMAVHVSFFSGHTRCVFSEIIRLTGNRINRGILRNDIYSILISERACEHSQSFECNCFVESTCIIKRNNIDDAIAQLVERDAIRLDEDNSILYIK